MVTEHLHNSSELERIRENWTSLEYISALPTVICILKTYCFQADVAKLKTKNHVQKRKHKKLEQERVKNFPTSNGFIIKIKCFIGKTMSIYDIFIKSDPLVSFA